MSEFKCLRIRGYLLRSSLKQLIVGFISFISSLAQIGLFLVYASLLIIIALSFFMGLATIFDNISKPEFIIPWAKPVFLIFLVIVFFVGLFLCFKAIRKTIGFWNVVLLNSLDVALHRPMRRFEQRDERLSFISLWFILCVLTILGFILLIIPGIFFIVRASMAYPIMLEEKCSPIQAISKSIDMTRGNFWPILIAYGIFSLLFFIPFLNIINIFIPITSWNQASLYAQLKNK